MNKLLPLILATAASAVVPAQPVLSQTDKIVVTPSAISQQAFVDKVSRDLDRQLRYASRYNEASGEGIVTVRFTRDDDGEPTDVTLYRQSGKRSLDRVALRAVGRLNSLAIVPSGIDGDQVYQANIIFAESESGYRKLNRQLVAQEATRIAANTDKIPVLAFGNAMMGPSS